MSDYSMKYFPESEMWNDPIKHPNFDTIDECYDYIDSLYDEEKSTDDYTIYNTHNERVGYVQWTRRRKCECPICGKMVRRDDMDFSRDCHGIPYRLMCLKCWDKIMDSDNGYDGEYYTSADECLDYDY